MRTVLASVCFGLLSVQVLGKTVTTCRAPEGYSYYHYQGLTPADSSGFTKDKLSNGVFTFKKLPDGGYDILYVDIRKKITSSVEDGATVRLLRRGESDATFITLYPGSAIDLFTIWVDSNSKPKFDLIVSRGGDSTLLHKSGVLVGDCDPIDLSILD